MTDSPLSDIRIGQVTHHWAQAQKIKSNYTEKTDSTNLTAKKEAFAENTLAENILLYLADQQTDGRGRGQNKWHSAASGSQLFSTWSFLFDQAPQPTITPQIGLAVYRAAVATWPFLKWNLKAPNDLYIDEKKIAGLLVETVSQGSDIRLLIGFGFNVLSFPAEIETATSLVHELPKETPLLAEDWIAFLERTLFEFSFALQLSAEPLNSTTCTALLSALNQHPLLKEKYTELDAKANLKTKSKKISWSEL